MTDLKEINIYFNNPDRVYKPGETVTGVILIKFNSPKKVKYVFITVIGKASCSWTVDYGKTKQNFSSIEEYFRSTFYIIGEKHGSEIDFTAGQHVYTLNFLLPQNIPPTFRDRKCRGEIKYKVKATLKRSWKIFEEEEYFIVDTLSNQHDPLIKQPIIMKKMKRFGIFFKSKPLTVAVETPQQGFYAGQIIPLTIYVDNQSNTTVQRISLKFIQINMFYTKSYSKEDKKTISENHITTRVPGKNLLIFNHTLAVPNNLVLTDLSNCEIMDVLYIIKVYVITAGLTVNLKGSMRMIPIKL